MATVRPRPRPPRSTSGRRRSRQHSRIASVAILLPTAQRVARECDVDAAQAAREKGHLGTRTRSLRAEDGARTHPRGAGLIKQLRRHRAAACGGPERVVNGHAFSHTIMLKISSQP